ncbi:Ig-like domain-containing protein, partial [Acinetobacter seifertii]|uniref:Ig-like domain-containing protein n=1 Tax=Acinetobacter seifertii TaxID=1530123 RepID=UPI0028107A4C
MTEIKIISKESHDTLLSTQKGIVNLTEASVVLIKINKEDVLEIRQNGRDAIILLKSGEQIIIVNFFSNENYESENSIVFEDNSHKLLWVQFTDSKGALLDNITYSYIDSVEPLLYHEGGVAAWEWLAVPLTAAGILLWAGNGSSSDQGAKDTTAPNSPFIKPINGSDPISGTAEPGSTVTVSYPDGNTKTVVVGSDGGWSVPNPGLNNGDTVTAVATDPAGNSSTPATAVVDAIAPNAPVIDPVNGTDPITGTAEPGSTVTVTYPDGSTTTAVAGSDGSWSVPNPGLNNGDTVTAVSTDPAGNSSTPATAVVDAIAPNAPVIEPVNATDPITGTAEPGSTVTVSYPDGSTASVVAGTDGGWSVPNPGLNNGDTVTAVSTDPAGNSSTPATAVVDAIAPNAPVIEPVNATDPISGTAEPGSTVTVTYPDGSTASVVAGTDGGWSVPNPGLNNGDTITAVATDPAGNSSTPATAVVDAIAPNAPVIEPVNATDPISGTAEPGSTVTVTYPDGSTTTAVA